MLNFKESTIEQSLDKKNIRHYFQKRCFESNDLKYSVYYGNIQYDNAIISLTIDIDESEYSSIYYKVGEMSNNFNRVELLDLLNIKSATNHILKYYIAPKSNEIMAKITYLQKNDNFDADYFTSLIEIGIINTSNDIKDMIKLESFKPLG